VDINTGDLMLAYHDQLHGRNSRFVALWAARHMHWISASVKGILKLGRILADLFDPSTVTRASRMLQKATLGVIPSWSGYFPGPARHLPELKPDVADLVYFPSCLARTLAGTDDSDPDSLSEAFAGILESAGLNACYPERIKQLCCGLAFSSKGHADAAIQSATQVVDQLWAASQGGKLPIVMDTTPCTRFIREYDKILSGITAAKWRQLQVLDIVEYLHATVMPRLQLVKLPGDAVLHPTCSTQGLDTTEQMRAIAAACAEDVVIPQHLGCCGFAGDRGLNVPALTDSATAMEAREVQEYTGSAGFYSTSRTCEVGMSQATEQPYQNIVFLVKRALEQAQNSS
jgi:D-lactate dehydrogenase